MTRVETGGMEIMSAKSRDPPFPPTATEPATAKATPQSARQPSPVVSRWPATWLRRHDHGRHDARRRLVKASPSTRTRITQAAVRHLGQ